MKTIALALLLLACACGGSAPATTTSSCDARAITCPDGGIAMSDCGSCRADSDCSAASPFCVQGACFSCAAR